MMLSYYYYYYHHYYTTSTTPSTFRHLLESRKHRIEISKTTCYSHSPTPAILSHDGIGGPNYLGYTYVTAQSGAVPVM